MSAKIPTVIVALLATVLAVMCLVYGIVWAAATFAAACIGLLWLATRS